MKRLFVFLVFFISLLSADAVPVKPSWQSYRQTDGTVLQVQLCGDENFHYYRTLDNVPLLRNDKGDFCYANVVGFGLKSTGVIAHNPQLRTSEELSFLPVQQDVCNLRKYVTRNQVLKQNKTRKQLSTRAQSDSKEKRGLVVMVSFPDRQFSSDTASVVWNNILNQEGYSENGAFGSVHDYFMDQSNGLFNLKFDVVGPVLLTKSCYYYGKNNPLNDNDIDINMDELIVEACQAIDSLVNFRDYDWNSDGIVEQVFFLYAGWGEAVSGAKSGLIWPHEYWLTAYSDYPKGLVVDSVTIDQYACGCEMDGKENVSNKLSGLGIFCHEFSHCLGLPDFYTYTGLDILGEWDLLSYGSYNAGGWCPPNFTSYEREFCGWLQPILLNKPTSVADVASLSDGGNTYKIVNDAISHKADEYYLLENRQQKGWDKYIPGHGLLVLHVDYDEDIWYNNTVNDIYSHPRMTIIPANNSKLTSKANGYAYPYLANDSLTDNSLPAANVFNLNSKGKKMGKPITKIREYDGLVAFDFMGGGTIDAGIDDVAIKLEQYNGQPARIYGINGQLLFVTSSFSQEILPDDGIYIIRFNNGIKVKLMK